ncbi:ATP/GTP-binding protein [Streptomyces sp. NPDC057910]|uniref:ATP/GTP-binding protein n=1 Tax=Streptomyces sp. NPDC057910 TaxID=3346278 RepID=UPI0036F180D1
MLRQRLTLLVAALAFTAVAVPAHADGDPRTTHESCGPFFCVGTKTGGTAGGEPDGKAASDGKGSSNTGNQSGQPECIIRPADPMPDKSSQFWEGHTDGAIYEKVCPTGGLIWFWAPTPPAAAQVDPAVLAQQAVDKMLLRGPQIGITPKPGGKGVVGMPVYLWTATGAETYGPNTASASAGGVTVTATAKVSKIVWSMGDGQSVTCTTAGTPYQAEFGKQPSPDCGYRYSQPSSTRPSGTYHVTATSTWSIDWTGGGQTGQLTETRTSAVDITVAEVQVLN